MTEDLPELGLIGRNVEKLQHQVVSLKETVGSVRIRFSALEARFGALETRLGGIEDRLSGVENRLDRSEDRLDRIEDLALQILAKLDGAYSAEVGHRFLAKSATCSNRSRPGVPVKSAGVASSAG